MNCRHLILVVAAAPVLLYGSTRVFATTTPVLGSAEDFAVLGASTVTNTGSTTLIGQASPGPRANLGVYAGTAITDLTDITFSGGFGTAYAGGPIAQQAQIDNVKAYNALSLLAPTTSYSIPTDLAGMTLSPGVYFFSSSAALNGTLTLAAGADPNAYWVFEISSTLITGSGSKVELTTTGTNTGSDVGVYWLVGSSATLGTTTSFEGNILALASITLNTNATILNGRALAQTGAVTMDTNTISDICPSNLTLGGSGPPGPGDSGGLVFNDSGVLVAASGNSVPILPAPLIPTIGVPEPGTFLLAGCGLLGLAAGLLRRSAGRRGDPSATERPAVH